MSKEKLELKNKWLAMGAPLTMEKELLALRRDVEGDKQHKKVNRVILKAAYNEMRERQGMVKRKMNCGRCISDINEQMLLWYQLYDARTPEQIKKSAIDVQTYEAKKSAALHPIESTTTGTQLPTLDNRKQMYNELEYADLLNLANTKLPEEAITRLKDEVKGRPMYKKESIIVELLKYKP